MHNLHKVETNGDKTIVSGKCEVTGEDYSVTVPTNELQVYLRGELLQVAMPSVSDGDREFIHSGISPKGWDELFKDVDDDEEPF